MAECVEGTELVESWQKVTFAAFEVIVWSSNFFTWERLSLTEEKVLCFGSPVDCIHWVTAAQLTLLEDEMRRVERVNVRFLFNPSTFFFCDENIPLLTCLSWRG